MLDKLYWVLSIDNEVKMNWRAKGKLCSVGHKAALGGGWVGGGDVTIANIRSTSTM